MESFRVFLVIFVFCKGLVFSCNFYGDLYFLGFFEICGFVWLLEGSVFLCRFGCFWKGGFSVGVLGVCGIVWWVFCFFGWVVL